MSLSDTDVLADLVAQRHRCLTELYAFSQAQAAAIARGDMNELLALLEAKHRALHVWQSVEKALRPYRDQPAQERIWRDPRAQERCRRQLQECEQLLQQMILLEQACDAELRARRDALAGEIRQVQQAQAVRQAYAVPSRAGSTLDLQSEG